jgi:tetratricopeptide (TPR) repeat protein
MYRILLLMCGFFLTTSAALAQAQQSAFQEVDLLRAAGELEQVRGLLEAARQERPGDAEALWRLSRTYVDLGERAAQREQQEIFFQKGIDIAGEAVEADDGNDNAHLAYAIAAGRLGLISGTGQKVELSRVVKEHVDRALALNPHNAAAYHVRARWNYAIADLGFVAKAAARLVYGGLPVASFEQAVNDYRHATELDNRTIHYLELGRTYLKLGRKEEARASFRSALAAPHRDPADPQHKQEVRDLLEQLEG